MIKEFLRKSLKHILAIVLFVGLSVAFFYPIVLENKTLVQYDIKSGKGWGKDAYEYHNKSGEYAHWSNAMFSGMPANYTYMPKSTNIFKSIGKVLSLDTPNSVGLLFLYMLGFYLLLVALGCSIPLGIIGAIAYAFCSYNLVIIDAGHIIKGLVMATMAPIIGGVILCYRGRYVWGTIMTLIFTGLNVAWAHQQISYYLLLTMIILFLVYLFSAIKNHSLTQFAKSSGLLLIVVLLAITPSLGSLLPTMDYSKETMRGGSVLKSSVNGKDNTAGLDIDYAYQWSYGKMEAFTLLIPNFAGGSSTYKIGKETKTYKALSQIGQTQAAQSMPMYWADNQYKTFTSGTVYAGAIICFLFVLGLIIVKRPERWWILGATIMSLILAWGRNLYGINEFLFNNLPLYNKFRTPEMALIIANMTMALLGMLAIKEIVDNVQKHPQSLLRAIWISSGITGGLCLIFALFGSSMFDFVSNADAQMPEWLQSALVEDRKAMLTNDSFRSLAFILLAGVSIFVFVKKKFPKKYLLIVLGVLIFIDLWSVDRRFIYAEKFVSQHQAEKFVPSSADQIILQDKDPNYRVFNLATSTFNESNTSYFHKSIGGYSPAKLRRYQDIIDYYLGNALERNRLMNEIISAQGDFSKISPNAFPIINMLNTKYFILPSQQGLMPLRNPYALGNVWLVDSIKWVSSPDEEIVELGQIDPKKTILLDKVQKDKLLSAEELSKLNSAVSDTIDKISLKEYLNPGYITYDLNSTKSSIAVFSEIYYKTWKAYIDGKEVPLLRVNYTLRGVQVPIGKHTIELKCRDELIISSSRYSLIGSIAVSIVIFVLFGLLFYKKIKTKKDDSN